MTIEFREPGIYFGMPEAEYHADPSLGSTDMKRLEENPEDYWFSSPLNPVVLEGEEETDSQGFGTACHKMLLEGPDAFERAYHICFFPGNIKEGKEERRLAAALGKTPLKESDWERIALAGAAFRANPVLAPAFEGGLASEVSIFWRDERCIPKKMRADRMKIRATLDLKTISPQREMPFITACRRHIAAFRYDIQAAHYNEGRSHMRALLDAGRVHGAHDAKMLRQVADQKEWAYVIVFVKRKGAPLTYGVQMSHTVPHPNDAAKTFRNPVLDLASKSIAKAEENYLQFREKFGLETPWLTYHPLEELAVEDLPVWYGR